MDEDQMYDYIDFIREILYGQEAQKFSQSFNEKITKTTAAKLEKFYSEVNNFHLKLYRENFDIHNMLFFINQDFILPYNIAIPVIRTRLNNKAKYSTKTRELYSPLLEEGIYNEVYTFSSSEKNLNLLENIIVKGTVPSSITLKELENFSIVLKYKIYYLDKFNKLDSSMVQDNPNLFNFSEDEIMYIYLIYKELIETSRLGINKNILSVIKIENMEKFYLEREVPTVIIKSINTIINNKLNIKETNIDITVKAINKNASSLLGKDISIDRKLKIINYIFFTDDISPDITIEELKYFGPVLRYKIYYLNRVNKANGNIKYIIENNPELFNFNRDEIDEINKVYYYHYRPTDRLIVNILQLENIRLVDKYTAYDYVSNNLELIKTYKINISDDIKRVVKEEYIEAFKALEVNEDDEDDFRQEYKQRPSKVLEIIGELNMWDELPEIDFLNYYIFKDKYPKIKEQKHKINKGSIVKFLTRSEISEEELEEWNELYKSQYGADSIPPPPPDWWLLSRSADVHTKRTVNVTDCRIKLLIKVNTSKDIQIIANEIEKETERIAYKHGKEDNEKNLSQYVRNHTLPAAKILNCRISENEPRYYGYGGIWENAEAIKLSPDQRVDICDIVIKVWDVIQGVKHREEMYETLVTQFAGAFIEHLSKGACGQGWVGGLTSIFGSYAKDLGYMCMTLKEEETEQLKAQFLIDMRDDITVPYPTVSKLFSEISGILLDAKYDDEWDYSSHTKEENDSFDKKVKMYDILFEDENVSKQLKIGTMIEYVDCMLPTFFMRALDYFGEKETIVKIKEASKAAIEDFKQYKLDAICADYKKRKRE